VIVIVPPTVAKVNPAHERISLIDNDELLVVSPEENADANMIGVTQQFDVFVELSQLLLAVVAVNSKGHLHFFVQQNEDSHALFLKKDFGALVRLVLRNHFARQKAIITAIYHVPT
jgi:hypothetical protein